MVRLAVFLGNPGPEYARTRHNVAWMLADRLFFSDSVIWQRKFKGMFGSTAGGLLLLKPETFMNRSGESVAACAQFYRIAPDELLVVHDDIELPFGTALARAGGGLGGHNGLRDIDRALGSREFLRFRIGISRPTRGEVASYVLSRFTPEEERALPLFLERAAAELESLLGARGRGEKGNRCVRSKI